RQVLHWQGNTRDGETDYWPHNLLLEITLEAGWLTGLYVVVLLLIGLCRAYSRASSPETRAVFALLFFYIVNAMVSYDVNDNKLLFTFIALALAGLSGRGHGGGQASGVRGQAGGSLTSLTPDPSPLTPALRPL